MGLAEGGPFAGLRFAILTCSTSRSPEEDGSGAALVAAVQAAGGEVVHRALEPDDRGRIAARLRAWADAGGCDVVLTTGGTGLGPQDVTPEATADVATRGAPGLAEWIRLRGLEQTPLAALSRGVAAIRGQTLLVNLAGSPRAARHGVESLRPLLAHAVAVLRGGGHNAPPD